MNLGFLGINSKSVSLSILFEKKGHKCLFYDEDENLLFNLNNKIFLSSEPDIQVNLVETENIKTLNEVTEVINQSDFIFNFIDLPTNTDGSINSTPLFESLQQFYLCSHLEIPLYNKNFIVSTTLNIGDSKKILEKISQFGINFGYFPNFLNEGNVFKSFSENKNFVLGSDSDILIQSFTELFNSLGKKESNLFLMSLNAAEFVKFGISSIISSKIVITNMLGDFLISMGLEKEIPLVLKSITQIENSEQKKLFYGLGYGGNHLPQEMKSISKFANEKKVEVNLFKKIEECNDEHLKFMKYYFMSLNPNKNIPFLFYNSSYKIKLENSQKLKLCLDFLNEGYYVNVVQDEVVSDNLQKLSESYGYKLKFFKKNSSPEGFKINL